MVTSEECEASGGTIDDLVNHFRSSGLSVDENVPSPAYMERGRAKVLEREKGDKRYADHRAKLREIMAKRRKDSTLSKPRKPKGADKFPVETKDIILEGVKLSIEQYSEASRARAGFERMVNAQEIQAEGARKSGHPYFKVTYFHSGQFVLKILHYEVKESYEGSPLEKGEINIDPGKLSRIKAAFESFKS